MHVTARHEATFVCTHYAQRRPVSRISKQHPHRPQRPPQQTQQTASTHFARPGHWCRYCRHRCIDAPVDTVCTTYNQYPHSGANVTQRAADAPKRRMQACPLRGPLHTVQDAQVHRTPYNLYVTCAQYDEIVTVCRLSTKARSRVRRLRNCGCAKV